MVVRRALFALLLPALLGAGCATVPAADPVARRALAPTGALRVGVYLGSPSSLVRAIDGRDAGVAHDLGAQLAQELGVPVRYERFDRVAQVLSAMKRGEVDFTVTNATVARARDVDFTPPVLQLELGYLVHAASPIVNLAGIDRPGVRVGVTEGSSSSVTLARQFRSAQLVAVPSLAAAAQQLRAGGLDAFATNKAILFEMADQVPGAAVLPGRWGLEHLAIAVPQGRGAGRDWLNAFATRVRGSDALAAMVKRAGLRGTAQD